MESDILVYSCKGTEMLCDVIGTVYCPRNLWPSAQSISKSWWGCGSWGSNSGWCSSRWCDWCAVTRCYTTLPWYWNSWGCVYKTDLKEHHNSNKEESGMHQYNFTVFLYLTLSILVSGVCEVGCCLADARKVVLHCMLFIYVQGEYLAATIGHSFPAVC